MMNFLSKSIEGDDYKSDFSNVTWTWGVLATSIQERSVIID
jgi:hypothetical protein